MLLLGDASCSLRAICGNEEGGGGGGDSYGIVLLHIHARNSWKLMWLFPFCAFNIVPIGELLAVAK